MYVKPGQTEFKQESTGLSRSYNLGKQKVSMLFECDLNEPVVLKNLTITTPDGITVIHEDITFKDEYYFDADFLPINCLEPATFSFTLTDLQGDSVYRDGQDIEIMFVALIGEYGYINTALF